MINQKKKQEIYIGTKSIDVLKTIINNLNISNIFLCTGRKSYENSGFKKLIESVIEDRNFYRFSENSPNPTIEEVNEGVNVFKKNDFDCVIAVGGGSVIDAAKMITFFAHQDFTPEDYFLKKENLIHKKTIPLIAIPTTSGTGSESTQFATVYINKKKFSLDNELILPTFATIDPIFTKDLTKHITAYTGMDALSQAIESYWNINSTDISKEYSRKSIELLINNLEIAFNNPTDEIRLKIAEGANLAGRAIQITKTTAPHAVSYPMTAHFNIPHGQAVGLTLPYFFEFNYNVDSESLLDTRGVDYVKKTIGEINQFLGTKTCNETKKFLINLMTKLELKTSLKQFNISKDNISIIIRDGLSPSRVKNNPRLLTQANLQSILEQIV